MAKNRKYLIVGVDEAGRGPLAGPVSVAVVSAKLTGPANSKFEIRNSKQIPITKIQKSRKLTGIRDSKKLSTRQREEWFEVIKENFDYKVAMVGPEVIDRIGISKAIRLATQRALRNLLLNLFSNKFSSKDCIILLDGLLKAPRQYKQETIIKGDEKVPLISAASVMAKVTRDRKMVLLHKRHPQYGFDKHKGYGTKAHYEAIKKYGLTDQHRRSYLRRN